MLVATVLVAIVLYATVLFATTTATVSLNQQSEMCVDGCGSVHSMNSTPVQVTVQGQCRHK